MNLGDYGKFIALVGVPGAVVLFICLWIWHVTKRLLPHAIERLKTGSRASEAITKAIPGMEESLQRMATDERPQRIEARVDQIWGKLNAR